MLRAGELPHSPGRRNVASAGSVVSRPPLGVLSIAKHAYQGTRTNDTTPSLGRGSREAHRQLLWRRRGRSRLDADVRGDAEEAGRVDADVELQCRADAKRVPRAAAPPAAVVTAVLRREDEGHWRGCERCAKRIASTVVLNTSEWSAASSWRMRVVDSTSCPVCRASAAMYGARPFDGSVS
ncbi:hypothetical protein BC567DRAFT_67635 [Phyllosticta citribraziliensis]